MLDKVKIDNGGKVIVPDAFLDDLKTDARAIDDDARSYIWGERVQAQRTLQCWWPGQSLDGKRRQKAYDADGVERKVFPYEGAPDARVRLADSVVANFKRVIMAVVRRSVPRVTALNADSTANAATVQKWLRRLLRVTLRKQFIREVRRGLHWFLADTPAVAIFGCYWDRKMGVKFETMTSEDFVMLVHRMMPDMQVHEVEMLVEQLMDETRDEETVQVLMEGMAHLAQEAGVPPFMDEKRAKRIIKDLRERNEALVPVTYVARNQPKICAHRLLQDVFIHRSVMSADDSPRHYVREWVTKAELESRVESEGYSEKFVNQLIYGQDKKPTLADGEQPAGHAGESIFHEYTFDGESSHRGQLHQVDNTLRREQYELVHGYMVATNQDGLPATYKATFSGSADVMARNVEAESYPLGFPLVIIQREVMDGFVWESRGLPELLVTDQDTLKVGEDTFNAYVELNTIPPYSVPRRRANVAVVIKPMAKIAEDRPGEFEWKKLSEYPRANPHMRRETRRRVAEYVGHPDSEVAEDLVHHARQDLIDTFMEGLSELCKILLAMYQEYATDEEIAQITGANGVVLAQSGDQLAGDFDISMGFDERFLDLPAMAQFSEFVQKALVPLDRQGQLQLNRVVSFILQGIDPEMEEMFMIPAPDAAQAEIEDEKKNVALMQAGVEPEMVEQGQNHGMRLQFIMEWVQQNQDLLQMWPEKTQEIFQRRVQHLQFMVQQQQNAVIGRLGASPTAQGGM
jgi:hypothetical protein